MDELRLGEVGGGVEGHGSGESVEALDFWSEKAVECGGGGEMEVVVVSCAGRCQLC